MNDRALAPRPCPRPRPRLARFLTASLLALAGLGPGAAGAGDGHGRAPDLSGCPGLAVPEGSRVAFRVFAQGVQIYRWTGEAWAFVAPEAVLYADEGLHGVVGSHYAGPTWEGVDGSQVVGSVVARCAHDPDAIPWLRLAAVSDGPGRFQGLSDIQRLDTAGGLPPVEPGRFPGDLARVPYTATYWFYRPGLR